MIMPTSVLSTYGMNRMDAVLRLTFAIAAFCFSRDGCRRRQDCWHPRCGGGGSCAGGAATSAHAATCLRNPLGICMCLNNPIGIARGAKKLFNQSKLQNIKL